MGIGLVDPILPALASKLDATPSQMELLFTSYLVVTAVAMLVTGWASSRLGAKRTLVVGLVQIVIFSALAGASNSIGGIVGFRAGWGLGNALSRVECHHSGARRQGREAPPAVSGSAVLAPGWAVVAADGGRMPRGRVRGPAGRFTPPRSIALAGCQPRADARPVTDK